MKYWGTEERRTAFDLHRKGLTYAEIADKLPGRTLGAVRAMMAMRDKSKAQTSTERKEREKRASECSPVTGCAALRDATVRAIDRYARKHDVHTDVAARFLLSGVRA